MFGTVGRMRVKPGKMQELVESMLDPEGAKARASGAFISWLPTKATRPWWP